MFFQIIIVLEIHQRAEHGAVFHMMAVNNGVSAGWVEGTSGIDKKHTADIIIAVEVLAQIVLRVIRGVHDGIVDIGAFNGKPADEILILIV